MSDGVTVKVEGLDELERKLLALGQEMGAKALVEGSYGAAKVIQDKMKENIVSAGAYDTGLLYKSISRKRVIYAKDGTVSIITGVSKATKGVDKDGKLRVPWRYAHLVEANKPFAKDAGESTRKTVVARFTEVLLKKIKRYTT